MCFINCTLRESSIVHGTNFILEGSVLDKYKKAFVFHFKCSVWMNTVCCICVQLNRQCENHDIFTIELI